VVFVPVALNYDRVLEDRILMAAGAAGTRRFRARISVVAGFFVKQLWLRVVGRYHRFGYAAVSFGEPVSLKAYNTASAAGADVDAEDLADHLMDRIASVVPVVPVPLLARVLLHEGRVPQADLPALMERYADALGAAHVHLPRGSYAYAAEIALKHLIKRRIACVQNDDVLFQDDQRTALAIFCKCSVIKLQK